MSGSIPPSIITYEYVVSNNNQSFINLSFPFKVLITDIWFTGDYRLLNGTIAVGNIFEDSGRTVRLAAQKSKSPRTVISAFDPPSDWAPFFGISDPSSQTDVASGDDAFKPYMWLGIPEQADAAEYADSTTQWVGNIWENQQAYRSSTGRPPALKDANNPYWGNNGWNSSQFAANKYKTQMGVMNPGDVLNMFVYADEGDWTDYNNLAVVTVHVAYTGIAESIEPADEAAVWLDWWND